MEELRILDGGAIRDVLIGSQLSDRASRRFKSLADRSNAGSDSSSVAASDVRIAAEEEAAALLLGSELFGRQQLIIGAAAAAARLSEDRPDARLDAAAFEARLRDYLQAVADALQEEPMVVSVLDGGVLRGLLEDEDEFAMAAENVFDELDVDNSGKLNRGELKSAVEQLIAAVGFPNPSVKPEVDGLVNKLLIKYGGQGSQELGQTQFAKLLQDVLQDMAETLAAQPIVIVRDVKVLDGSSLTKVLEDEKLLSEMADSVFANLDSNKDGKLTKSEIRPVFESQAVQWGLPPCDESAEELYMQVFEAVDADKSGHVDRHEFETLVRGLIESFALQLRLNPLLVENEAAVQ